MPSATFELGRYVTVRTRVDGSARVYFEVPKRLRPPGWLPAIPLPTKGRTGRLDAEEVSRIQEDAKRLYAELQGDRRMAQPEKAAARSFEALKEAWLQSEEVLAGKPRTQKGYAYHAGIVVALASAGGFTPERLTRRQAEEALAVYADRPTTRRHLKITMKMMFDRAVALEWRKDNPVERIKVAAPQTSVLIWEAADVERMAAASVQAGQPSIAALIRMQWEIGQRMTDARLFRWFVRRSEGTIYVHSRTGEPFPGQDGVGEYDREAGVFRFRQSKTRSYVTIPVSDDLRATLAACERKDSPYLFTDAATGKPFEEARLGHEFDRIRKLAGEPRALVLRALRHSCVVQLARAGCTVPQIAAVTGHSLTSAEQILSRYLPRDNAVAWEAQARRGLVQKKVAGTEV